MALKRVPTPAGPITELFDRLHELHLHAGEPTLRRMARGLGGRGPSHATVHNVFKGPQVPKWDQLQQIVAQLGGDVDWFLALWKAARSAEVRPSTAAAPNPPEMSEGTPVAAEHPTYAFIMVTYRRPANKHGSSMGAPQAALGNLVARRAGAWIGSLDPAATGDVVPRASAPQLVNMTDSDVELHYEGFCNSSIWPLYHYSIERPEFRRAWDDANRTVNRRFADAIIRLAAPGAMVWVHDYQLQLVPAMVRAQRPDLRIGFFLHIPMPAPEVFAQLPCRDEILRGLLGADVIGFQQPLFAENLLRLARDRLGLRTTGSVVVAQDRRIIVDSFPVSVDVDEIERQVESANVRRRSLQIRTDLGGPRIMLLGIDRLDYTKGIEQRLRAYGQLLDAGELSADDAVFVQVGTPTRERIGAYAELRGRVERLAGRISAQHPRVGSSAVRYTDQVPSHPEILALFAATDVMVVTPFRDGMNLVAKEFVASRTDNRGVLILSEFAGAAAELQEAILVNPYDVDDLRRAMLQAITMDTEEQQHRMDAMRRRVRHHDVNAWTSSFVQRLSGPG